MAGAPGDSGDQQALEVEPQDRELVDGEAADIGDAAAQRWELALASQGYSNVAHAERAAPHLQCNSPLREQRALAEGRLGEPPDPGVGRSSRPDCKMQTD